MTPVKGFINFVSSELEVMYHFEFLSKKAVISVSTFLLLAGSIVNFLGE